MNYTIMQGDNRDTLKTLEDNSIDAIVTDPPYGIDFLGKAWDANTGALETYTECLRVLKPGGYILAFSAARTYHHLAVTLEQAGFEIRDQLMWLYSSGFPKAQDIGKMADSRILKGNASTRSQRQVAMGDDYTEVGHYTIHSGDVETDLAQRSNKEDRGTDWKPQTEEAKTWAGWKTSLKPAHEPICMARKPFKGSTIDNVLAHGVGALNIDATRIPAEQELIDWYNKYPEQKSKDGVYENYNPEVTVKKINTQSIDTSEIQGRFPSNVLGEIEGYQKYFYCPKVNRKERMLFNNHPTVKPVELMKYLIKLVTPPNSTVLDPFNGSGSTGMAAVELGHTYIGCELDPAYVDIAKKRIESWNTADTDNNFGELFETK